LPGLPPEIDLEGAVDRAVFGADVTLRPVAKPPSVSLRYELRLDGSLPPEPGTSSPLMGDSLAIPCPTGEALSVVLRYRSFEGDAASEGRILRFTLDKRPPVAPRPDEVPAPYSDHAESLVLIHGDRARDVFASVSANGAAAPFLPVSGPISLEGSDAGPVNYVIRAYDVDAIGNRSPEMKSLSLVVDRSSVYLAEDGDDNGNGSPGKPYRSLGMALSVARREGKKNINLRGSFELRDPVSLSADILLAGGFDALWAKSPGVRSAIEITVPRGQSAFTLHGGSLALHHVDMHADSTGTVPLVVLSEASLHIEDSSISASATNDLVLVSASRSRISISGATIQVLRAMSYTAFETEDCDIAISGSSFAAEQGVRIFGAFDMVGGSLALDESLIESRADLGLNLFSLRNASILLDRSIIEAEGGSGFLRIGSFSSVAGEIRNSKVLLSWQGPGTLFEMSGGNTAFRHDTIVADSLKGPLRFFDAQGALPQIWNSILDCSGEAAQLLISDSAPGAGVLVADCVWGFDELLAGAMELRDVSSLNALNAGDPRYASKPTISEPPSSSFDANSKSRASLRRGSSCIGAAFFLGRGYELDFNGRPRPAPGTSAPDIGAEEFFE
jgi:hypothetical protein